MKSLDYKYPFKDNKETTSLEVVKEKMQLIQEYVKKNYINQNGPSFSMMLENNPYIWIKYGVDEKGMYAEFGDHASSDGRYYFGLYPKDVSVWTETRCGARVGEFILLNWPEIKQFLNRSIVQVHSAKDNILNFMV